MTFVIVIYFTSVDTSFIFRLPVSSLKLVSRSDSPSQISTCRVIAFRIPLFLEVRIPWVPVACRVVSLISSAIRITIISSITRLIISWSPILNMSLCWCFKARNSSRQTCSQTSVTWWWPQPWRHDNCWCLGDGLGRCYPSEQGWYYWRRRD